MSNNKNSSLDWLIEEINKQKAWADPSKLEPIIQQAKAMHKEEIMDAFMLGKWDWSEHIGDGKESKDPAEYYNETFNE